VVRIPGYRSSSPGFDSRRYQIFWQVVRLEWGPLSFANTIQELIWRKSSCSVLETREYGRGDQLRWPRKNLYSQKLSLTSPTNRRRSEVIVHSRTKATEVVFSSRNNIYIFYEFYISSKISLIIPGGSLTPGWRPLHKTVEQFNNFNDQAECFLTVFARLS
jgi:hypothetical protein